MSSLYLSGHSHSLNSVSIQQTTIKGLMCGQIKHELFLFFQFLELDLELTSLASVLLFSGTDSDLTTLALCALLQTVRCPRVVDGSHRSEQD